MCNTQTDKGNEFLNNVKFTVLEQYKNGTMYLAFSITPTANASHKLDILMSGSEKSN